MKILLLDGYTLFQEDISWSYLRSFGEVIFQDRTSREDLSSLDKDVDVLITRHWCPDLGVRLGIGTHAVVVGPAGNLAGIPCASAQEDDGAGECLGLPPRQGVIPDRHLPIRCGG